MAEPTTTENQAEMHVLSVETGGNQLERTNTSIDPNVSCCERFKLLFCPIKSKTVTYSKADAQIELIIVPEAFRMWFYFGYFIFTVIAIIVSTNISKSFSSTDNPIIDRFGGNNICIFYDSPPFTYFGPTLWFPILCSILLYELFDHYRCYDAWKDGDIGRTFYYIYTVLTVFESFSFIWFAQVFATQPEQNIYMHTLPFMVLCYALWTLAFKRTIYVYKTGKLNGYHGCVYFLGIAYVFILLILVISFTSIVTANLFGAQLWLTPGWKWTQSFGGDIANSWMVFTLIIPLIIYAVITKDLETVTIILNRTAKK